MATNRPMENGKVSRFLVVYVRNINTFQYILHRVALHFSWNSKWDKLHEQIYVEFYSTVIIVSGTTEPNYFSRNLVCTAFACVYLPSSQKEMEKKLYSFVFMLYVPHFNCVHILYKCVGIMIFFGSKAKKHSNKNHIFYYTK